MTPHQPGQNLQPELGACPPARCSEETRERAAGRDPARVAQRRELAARAEKREPADRAEHSDPADRTENAERKLPMEPIEQAEPMEPIEQAEPMEPMDSTEPLEPIERNEPSDHSDHRDLPTACSYHLNRIAPRRRRFPGSSPLSELARAGGGTAGRLCDLALPR